MVNEAANGAKHENVPNYVNESAYTEDITGRTNVGDAQNRQRVAILDVATGEVEVGRCRAWRIAKCSCRRRCGMNRARKP